MGTLRPALLSDRPSERWDQNFVYDAFTDDRRISGLAIVDDLISKNPCLFVDTSLSGICVTPKRNAIITSPEPPKMIVGEKGTELINIGVLR